MNNVYINDIASLITTIATRKENINWIDLLPISEIISSQPNDFMNVVNQLNVGIVLDFIECISVQAAGIIGEVILWKMSESSYLLSDDNIKIYLHDNTIVANERIGKRLSFIKEKITVMDETKSNMKNRLSEGVDLVHEEVRISKQLEELRRDELSMDNSNLDRLHQMESEIIKLESMKRILDSYNFKERNSHKEKLKDEIESLDITKKKLENEIKELTGQRDVIKNNVINLTEKKENIENESKSLQNKKQNLSEIVSRLEDTIEELNLDKEALKVQILQAEKQEKEERKLVEKIKDKLNTFTILEKEIDGTPIQEAFEKYLDQIKKLIKSSADDETDKNFKR